MKTRKQRETFSIPFPWPAEQWQQASVEERHLMIGRELLSICWEMYTDAQIWRVFPDFARWAADLPHPPPAKQAVTLALAKGWQP